MKIPYALLLLFISIALQNSNRAQAQGIDSYQLTLELEEIYTQGFINGFSTTIVNQDGTLYTKGFGLSDVKANKPYTENTIQNIASISKTFIGISLLKAQELGKLKLDDPINNYLPFQVINPHFPNEKITIRQLATHTSSISDPMRYELSSYVLKEKRNPKAKKKINFRSPSKMTTMGVFLEKVLSEDGKWYKKKNFAEKKPGDGFKYSNVAATLAAYVLEQATGASYADFVSQHIFKPLGMKSSGLSFNTVDFTKYSKLYDSPKKELAFYRLVTYPDGGVITSAKDMGIYLTELIKGYNGKGEILTQESFKELFRQQLTETNFVKRNADNKYNDEYNSGIFMGWSAKGYVGHTGGDPGVVSLMFFNSETSIGKFIIVNTSLKKDGINEIVSILQALEKYEKFIPDK